jgi:hypothetical protein
MQTGRGFWLVPAGTPNKQRVKKEKEEETKKRMFFSYPGRAQEPLWTLRD